MPTISDTDTNIKAVSSPPLAFDKQQLNLILIALTHLSFTINEIEKLPSVMASLFYICNGMYRLDHEINYYLMAESPMEFTEKYFSELETAIYEHLHPSALVNKNA